MKDQQALGPGRFKKAVYASYTRPVLLLLGGMLSTVRGDFSAQIDALRACHRVIAPDRRGVTRTPERDFPDNFYEREARDMAALVEAMDLTELSVFGLREGAAVARDTGADAGDIRGGVGRHRQPR